MQNVTDLILRPSEGFASSGLRRYLEINPGSSTGSFQPRVNLLCLTLNTPPVLLAVTRVPRSGSIAHFPAAWPPPAVRPAPPVPLRRPLRDANTRTRV